MHALTARPLRLILILGMLLALVATMFATAQRAEAAEVAFENCVFGECYSTVYLERGEDYNLVGNQPVYLKTLNEMCADATGNPNSVFLGYHPVIPLKMYNGPIRTSSGTYWITCSS